jgi:hypothetical protein
MTIPDSTAEGQVLSSSRPGRAASKAEQELGCTLVLACKLRRGNDRHAGSSSSDAISEISGGAFSLPVGGGLALFPVGTGQGRFVAMALTCSARHD